MAIYHLHAKIIQRSHGKNVVAAAAYRHAALMKNEKEDMAFDYRNKHGVIHDEVLIPQDSPAWLATLGALPPVDASEQLWNLVETVEKRKDAQLAREIEFALPLELNQEQNITLAREFIHDQFVLRGMVADVAVHWDEGNPHVHVLLTMREITAEGFGQKLTAWNSRALLQTWREKWAEYANFHLRLHHVSARIDHRSYEEQGVELVPGIHQGKAVTDMERRGIKTAVLHEANVIRRENLTRIAAKPSILLDKLTTHHEDFSSQQLGQELGRYINDADRFSVVEKQPLSQEALANLSASITSTPVLTPTLIAQLFATMETHSSVFTDKDIAKALSLHTDHADLFLQAMAEIKTSEALIHLGPGDDGRERYTTTTMVDLENDIQQTADILRERGHIKISSKHIEQTIGHYQQQTGKQLTDEQLAAVRHVLTGPSIGCLVGRAGTGKSFSLGAAKAVWEERGLRVLGVALSGIAADGLTKDAGIDSRTIESFRYAIENGRIMLDQRSVVIMDEAGMTDSVSMRTVLTTIEQAQAKLVLVGDHAQLQPVGPGASFRALLERLGFAELNTVYRQKHAWQREATVALSAGDVAKGLSAYEEKGCLHVSDNAEDAMSLLVSDWQSVQTHANKSLNGLMVLAHRNEDVRALNEQLRASLVSRGQLAEGHGVQANGQRQKIAVGERLLFLKNDRRLGVANGRLATITAIALGKNNEVIGFEAMLDGLGDVVHINPETYNHFTLGYAATVHKTQGITVEHSFVYAGGMGWNRHLTYVALSRHKDSCQIYAAQDTHADKKTLFKNLGRLGIKDSVLDYPLAFAERRGIEIPGLSKILPLHLSKRLSSFVSTLRRRYEQRVDPEGYRQRHEEEASRALHVHTQAKVREDAKTVAAYVDAHCAVGQNWQRVQDKLAQLGLAAMPDEKEAFSLVAATEEYKTLQAAFNLRNELASSLAKEPERYQKAMEIHGLDLTKLHSQAESHAARERVQRYQQLAAQGCTVLQGRQAALIYAAIKAHYPAIKGMGVDTKMLRADAIAHLRRRLLIPLSFTERHAFRLVEAYKETNLAVARYYERYIKPYEATIIHREHVLALEGLREKRDNLASQIAQNPALYDKALNFYHIGLAVPYFDEVPTPAQCQYANERWDKLQKNAARHLAKERVKDYLSACQRPSINTRLALAAEIMQATKAHYAAMKQLGIDTGDGLFLQVWQDAKRYQALTVYKTLSKTERQGFKLVKAYVDAKQAHSGAWRELFKSRESTGVDEETFNRQMVPFAARYTHARNALAAALENNPHRCHAGLTYFEIKPEELKASAYAHQCRLHVEDFLNARPGLERANAAQSILIDVKGHYKALLERSVDRHQLYHWGRVAERHALFSNVLPEEKRFIRLMEKYRLAHQQVGKTYGALKTISSGKKTDINDPNSERATSLSDKLKQAVAKRDSLAHRLVAHQEMLALGGFEQKGRPQQTTRHRKPLNWEKVVQHANAHGAKQQHVLLWREANNALRHQLNQIAAMGNQSSRERMMHCLLDWSIDFQEKDTDILTQKIMANLASYQTALAQAGISSETLMHHQENIAVLKETLNQWVGIASASHDPGKTQTSPLMDPESQHRIQWVLKTVGETKPITDTLAERYLCRQRDLTLPLNDHAFRYHPHLKNKMTGTYHPALIVLARDSAHRVCGFQAVFLDPLTENKAALGHYSKLSHGFTREGALVQEGSINGNVAFAEGPETALSIAQAKPDWTVYVTFGVRNFDKVPLKTKASCVVICADNDGPGSGTEKAIEAAARVLSQHGKDVWIAIPDKPEFAKKWDFNDTLKSQGTSAIIKALDHAKLHQPGITQERLEETALTGALAIAQGKAVSAVASTALLDLYDLKSIAKYYVEMEIKQTTLIRERDQMRKHDRNEAKVHSEKALNHSQALSALAKQMMSNPEVIQEINALMITKAPSLIDRSGYDAIYARFTQGEFLAEDIKTVVARLRQRGLEYARTQTHDRHRGGRTQ